MNLKAKYLTHTNTRWPSRYTKKGLCLGYVSLGNLHVYLKSLNKVWKNLIGAYNSIDIVIVDDLKEKKYL